MTGEKQQDVRRRAGWLPDDQGQLEAWLHGHRERAGSRDPDRPLRPSVAAFRDLIESDPLLRMQANQMVEQVPANREYSDRHVESLDELILLVDEVIRTAPEYSDEQMVMTPLDGVLDWTKATPAGFAFYRDPRVNEALRGILDEWCEYLSSPASLDVLNDSPSGWMSESAQQKVGMERFEHDPDAEHWGFRSWNDFFTRRLREGARPVADPDDDAVIVSPIEATPYRIASRVQRRDEFWAKAEPYSIDELLAGDPSVDAFVDGTVFQAFLSAIEYHRWHSPVGGRIVRAWRQPGTYYAEADAQGAAAAQPTLSQGYMAHVATRVIILIEADDPAIGLVAVVFIGMSEVSSCVIGDGIEPGVHVAKGDDLGYFQFGGSTCCVLFGPGVVESFALKALPQAADEEPSLIHVRSHLATAHRGTSAG
ncbi:phosphatidylserine decarboxylase family protein [Curtobacterium sp. ISL-83]|uniref:phosphatidylserine decarboxylase family protein n=1 Tax=Curtobacterium sp. ISL-83 TaxID=2819145 RepID=UPI001BE71162|nr:phosphatidylserine decarboxylase family protein [Curtobacterium sp. ISL-83]MBT2502344.1 phosphatidylserine decarboxylase family protein [Curtobacterium sp. ISL-83]